MTAYTLLLVYGLAIVAASLAGGVLPSRFHLTHVRMQCMLSFVGGLMLGIGLLHLLPHGVAVTGSLDWTLGWALAGLLFMFFLIRTFHFHHHGPDAMGHAHSQREPEGPGHPMLEAREVGRTGRPAAAYGYSLNWVGVALGLALHTLLDGLALSAAVEAESTGHQTPIPRGFAVFLAILLHKPLDALSITTLMASAGWPHRARQYVNLGFALMCPLGAWLSTIGFQQMDRGVPWTVGAALGFSAGIFLCISLSDLLPEVQFHRHDRIMLSGALALGVLMAIAVGHLEPTHLHETRGNGPEPGHVHPDDPAPGGRLQDP